MWEGFAARDVHTVCLKEGGWVSSDAPPTCPLPLQNRTVADLFGEILLIIALYFSIMRCFKRPSYSQISVSKQCINFDLIAAPQMTGTMRKSNLYHILPVDYTPSLV